MFCNPCLNLPIVNTYFYAETNCKHKCFRDKETDEIVINNQLWEKSQKVMLLERQQKGQTNADLDNYYRSEIKSKLTQANFRENSTHVRMEFVAFFGESESEAVGRPLCDSCYVAYSCHKSKEFLHIYFIICTYVVMLFCRHSKLSTMEM